MTPPSGPSSVRVTRSPVSLPTYLPAAPDPNPMFLDKRVYQGSSGRVYPLPFTDRIAEEAEDVEWDAVHIENEYLRLMILPQIGGRIHVGEDKTNGYDFFYRQEVIKPALVGLAGPWISGGVEFNWPQHHRPSTFMPADVEIEEHPDGSRTVWLAEHEPMGRMKGMHGVCLHPDSSVIELKARLYNRTPFVQTFLWWANVATRVHERYQSFFPTDVHYVADHAKRSMSEFPLCTDRYYGVDYSGRAADGVPENEQPANYLPPGDYPANDLGWYANIPVPTSYMCMGTDEDFFGGYDHGLQAGVVHVANHHISPGKKQWTWGNHEFGYAWDRNLTDPAKNGEYAPYIELMAGVYTDNQPDFSFLMPGETRTWSQFWYPIREIGVPRSANCDAAVSVIPGKAGLRLGVAVTRPLTNVTVTARSSAAAEPVFSTEADLAPGKPLLADLPAGRGEDLEVTVVHNGRTLLTSKPVETAEGPVPPPAAEPPLPGEIESNDELYLTGLHLEQYRHASRRPELYWGEAVRRDPGDARSNNALGLWRLRRGEFAEAEAHFNRAVERLTRLNPNPRDGEPYYNLGLALRYQGRDAEAYDPLYKATWNEAWRAPGFVALAELDCRAGDWTRALDHLDHALRHGSENTRALVLRALALGRLGRDEEARSAVETALAADPLDWWARRLADPENARCDPQTALDLAHDFARAGFFREAIELLESQQPDSPDARALGSAPLLQYTLGWLHQQNGDPEAARRSYAAGAAASPDYCFPARLEEIAILEAAIASVPDDARAPYFLGNLFYDRGPRDRAIELWESSARLDQDFPTVWRNLGIARHNVCGDPAGAREAYERAFAAGPADARVLYERDQLWKRTGVSPADRLAELERHPELTGSRDDLAVEMCALYNATGQPETALAILEKRHFQPWEGGEGQVLGQHVRTHLALGRKALEADDPGTARNHFEASLQSPPSLGEAKHLLANCSDAYYWLGNACNALGDADGAKAAWSVAAASVGDFQEMSVKPYSEMTYYSTLALQRLGRDDEAGELLRGLLDYAEALEQETAKIDYFATSLPTMLVFDDDIQARQETTAKFLQAQARLALGERDAAEALIAEVLARDPNHPQAADLRGAAAVC